MKSTEYIERIMKDITSHGRLVGSCPREAFLGAALEIIREVESPLKEEALVTLATLERAAARDDFPVLRKTA